MKKKENSISIVAISDSHGLHHGLTQQLNNIEGSENMILIHAGDISNVGRPNEVEDFLKWYNQFTTIYYKVIFIVGNHDWLFEKDSKLAKKLLKKYPKIKYLQNSSIKVKGFKIWGSPYQPEFYNWAFNKKRGSEIKAIWDLIPEDTDILVTHGPPKGYGDLVDNFYQQNEHVGCEDLMNRINELPNLLINFFGHIHDGYGIYEHSLNTTMINASVLNDRYELVNKPILYTVKK